MFEVVARGLDQPPERRFLAATVLVAAVYVAGAAWLAQHSIRSDRDFLLRREARRLATVAAHPIACGGSQPVVTDGHPAAGLALISGWSDPEPWGVWSAAPTATLAIALPPGCRKRVWIELDGNVELDPQGSQTVVVASPGKTLGTFRLKNQDAALTVPIPPDAIDPDGLVRLAITVAHPMQRGADPRSLGIGLKQLRAGADG